MQNRLRIQAKPVFYFNGHIDRANFKKIFTKYLQIMCRKRFQNILICCIINMYVIIFIFI